MGAENTKPANRSTGGGLRSNVESGEINTPNFIDFLPAIKSDPKAERKFALELAARVFGTPARRRPRHVKQVAR
jgi:hypothetical protein